MKADLVIVGAGMVGSLLAASLRDLELRIVLVDPERIAAPAPDALWEPRVSAISLASENLLRHAGAWGRLPESRLCAYDRMEVWEEEGNAALRFRAEDIRTDHLGHLAENRVLQWALTECARENPSVDYRSPSRMVALERFSAHWRVTLDDGETLDTALVVGADGAQSRVRDMAAIGLATWDYRQKGLVCTVRTALPHGRCARQVFLRGGPLAFLPLAEPNTCSIVWSCGHDRADALLALDDAAFRHELGLAFGDALGDVLWVDRRYAFPFIARHAERYVLPGLALIGDAAHTVHPLAGQGVNMGFLDAAVLAEEVAAAVQRGLPVGHLSALERYSRRRRPHNALTMHTMTGLERIYASVWPWLIQARNDGVTLVDRLPPLKQFFERQAAGLQGDLPRLAQACPDFGRTHRATA